MAIAVNDIVSINVDYVTNVIAKMPSDPTLRQTINSLERLCNTQCRVLDRGRMANPDLSGTLLYWIRLIPLDSNHLMYKPVYDGPARGILIYFYSAQDLEATLTKVSL